MSNEQKLREALRETLLFCETFSNRWDGETGAHPFDMVERARQALATTEPEPTGMPEVKPWDHPEPQTMRWSDLEIRWIQSYGEQCWKAGYKHGAWGDKPAVNQQLTTDPFDEREAFEKWLGIKPCGAAHDIAWSAWQARAALAARKPLSAVVLGESMSATFPGSNESSDGWFHQPDDPLQLAASLRRIAKEREQEFNSTFYFGYVADMLETCPHCHGSGLDEETFEACTKCNGTGKRDGLEVKT